MAVKITHKARGQQLRFGSRDAAEWYAERYGGGVDKWEFVTVPYRDPHSPAEAHLADSGNQRS